jgi:ABC-type glycerol-3-phosphate transport system permease component
MTPFDQANNTRHADNSTGFPRLNTGMLILYGLMIFVTILWGAPLLWMLVTSLKPETEIYRYPIDWLPDTPTMDYYIRLFSGFAIGKWFRNSLIVATITTLIALAVDILAAYPLARIRFRGRRIVMVLILSTFLIPGEILVVPLFLGLSRLGMVDSYFSLAVPAAANAFGVFLLTQFFQTIPIELEEAARLDGCSRMGILRWIILPLSRPALATVAIFTFVRSWNDFLWPLIVSNSDETRTIPIGLATFVGQGLSMSFGIIMASAVVATIPAVILFLLLQRYFVMGISTTGLK